MAFVEAYDYKQIKMNFNIANVYQCRECKHYGKDICFRKDETVEMSRIHCDCFVPRAEINMGKDFVTAASKTIELNDK